jgi:hypothetical protein
MKTDLVCQLKFDHKTWSALPIIVQRMYAHNSDGFRHREFAGFDQGDGLLAFDRREGNEL